MKLPAFIVGVALLTLSSNIVRQDFDGHDDPNLVPVANSPDPWGLKIVVFDVGQADAVLLMTPNGDTCMVDTGKTNANGDLFAAYLKTAADNGVGELNTLDLLYTTHYDRDHIGGITKLRDGGIRIRKAFDQGLSVKRDGKTFYTKYVTAVGDPNNNYVQDADEPDFVRHRLDVGHSEFIGATDDVEIRCVSVRGDTVGDAHDLPDLDPSVADIDENPGSIALLVRLGEFEFYTAGDQTDDDWKHHEPAVEEKLIAANAIPGGNDIDVIKVSHHGSDTSTSASLVTEMDPEVAIISSDFVSNQGLPKRNVIQLFEENDCYVLVTGDGINPDTDQFTDSGASTLDDNYRHDPAAVFNARGTITVLVSTDGTKYTVLGDSFSKTFSAKDSDNVH